jgi:ubiquinone/menaquinone biosynthesis C-methylase UbiE
MTVSIERVRSFWNANPCQHDLSIQEDRRAYFEEISRKRYEGREWHVPLVADFARFRGQAVLEIGCGIGTDGFEFARHGARYSAVDLTPESAAIARERFALFGVSGDIRVANAEEGLPFADASFDHIYSFGVIHHSPNPEAIVREMYRVLRPGGTFAVMLYNRSSINYRVEIMILRRLFRYLLYPSFMPKLLARLPGFDCEKLQGHRELLGRPLTREQWVSMNTDGPHCPLARVYNKAEAAELFSQFGPVEQEIWEFNTEHWSVLGKLVPETIARWIGRRAGWHRIIRGRRPVRDVGMSVEGSDRPRSVRGQA